MLTLPRIALLAIAALVTGCSVSSPAATPVTVTASTSPEAGLCERAAKHIDTLHGSASAEDFRAFSAAIAEDLQRERSTVGVDLAIANSYAMLLGIDLSAYRDPGQRLDTAVDFVNALQTYVDSCTDLGVRMPDGWQTTETQNDPRAIGGRSRERDGKWFD